MALESSPEQPQPLGRVLQAVKQWVERCNAIWIEAQVIELKRRQGPTQFLVLRDPHAEASATITCPPRVLDAAGPVVEGMTVVAWVRPTVFTKNGSLTFECAELRIAGEGRLLAQIEQRKRLLYAEGLFDPARKRPLPFLPHTVGLVTAANSAAEADVVTTIHRRWPAARIQVRHALMQGPSAAIDVMGAVADLDGAPGVDVIIIARGGGSLEDLLPFSDEGLARAVAASRTPVVSAIGHESDSPILDLVADARASTPTGAAQMVVPDAAEQLSVIRQSLARVRDAVDHLLTHEQHQLDLLRSRPVLRDPSGRFELESERLAGVRLRLDAAIDRRLDTERSQIEHAIAGVRRMSPKATLERGYAILVDGAGHTVTSVTQVAEDDEVLAHLGDGKLVLSVRRVEARQLTTTDPKES